MLTVMRMFVLSLLIVAARAAEPPVLVCLGDSLTAGRGLTPEEAFPALLQKKLRADALPWRVVNAGISGDTTAGGLRRIEWVLKAKPRAVLIALGANDGLRGVPVAEATANLDAIVVRLQKAQVAVFLAGMRLPVNYGEDYRTAFDAMFPTLAKQRQIPLLPFLLEGVAMVPDLNQADGIHPTAVGQQRVADHVYAFVKPLLLEMK